MLLNSEFIGGLIFFKIQVPYNMERIFWMVTGGDAEAVKNVMNQYHETGKAMVPQDICTKVSSQVSLVIVHSQ